MTDTMTMTVSVTHKRNADVLMRAMQWAIDSSAASPDNFGKRFNGFTSKGKTVTFDALDSTNAFYVLNDSFGYMPNAYAITDIRINSERYDTLNDALSALRDDSAYDRP